MTGVEILAMEKIAVAYIFDWKIYVVCIAITAGLMMLTSCFYMSFDIVGVFLGLLIGIVFGAILGILPAARTSPSEYETHYKVITSDEVSMNSFLEKYEIINQDGKIYTVVERGD